MHATCTRTHDQNHNHHHQPPAYTLLFWRAGHGAKTTAVGAKTKSKPGEMNLQLGLGLGPWVVTARFGIRVVVIIRLHLRETLSLTTGQSDRPIRPSSRSLHSYSSHLKAIHTTIDLYNHPSIQPTTHTNYPDTYTCTHTQTHTHAHTHPHF